MEHSIIITEHAFDRIKERSKLNKKAAIRLVEKAYEDGIKHNETTGKLAKYIASIAHRSYKGTQIRIYGDRVYIFNKSNKQNKTEFDEDGKRIIHLITVLPLPAYLTKQRNIIMDKKKDKEVI